jgi:hypothetical protein
MKSPLNRFKSIFKLEVMGKASGFSQLLGNVLVAIIEILGMQPAYAVAACLTLSKKALAGRNS